MKKIPSQTLVETVAYSAGDTKPISKIFYWFFAVIMVAQVAGIFIVLSNNDVWIAQLIAISMIPMFGAYFLIRQNQFEFTVVFLSVILFTMLTVLATYGMGIHSISNAGFVVIVILSSLAVHRRTMAFLVVFSLLCIAWLVFGEIYGYYTPSYAIHNVPGDFFSMAVIIIATAIVTSLISQALVDSRQLLQKELVERTAIEAQLKKDVELRKQAEEQVQRVNENLELRVRERTAELETTVGELESFSYSVSHDLRAPLRAIAGYANILLNQHRDTCDEDARQMLSSIDSSSQHMSLVIDALLKFARLNRQPLNKAQVEIKTLVQNVVASFAQQTTSRRIDWSIGNLPSGDADPILIQLVFENLISNAVKFTRIRDRARIEIGFDQNSHAYFVRDNGIGFDMKYKDKLFGAFERLQLQDEYEGVGIGLATADRIIRRHGGRAWAEGEVDRGASFYFTLG